MSKLENALFELKFTAKTLSKQAAKAQKAQRLEEKRRDEAQKKGNNEGAQIYASNAMRKQSEALDLLRMSSRIDAVANRVETAVKMRQNSHSMLSVVNGMKIANNGLNLEAISSAMNTFESQFANLDVQTSYMENAMSPTTATSAPQDQISLLSQQTAERVNIELPHDLAAKEATLATDFAAKDKVAVCEEDAQLAERLRALRPAM
ncbi:hypothetical protein C0991_003542 [Blastosporella zonata]|nr:hypothetical protein C0991_003542 [Blastosporella zonata]